ncbi:type I-E CRISPR-associated protein Cas7/Cse4/CasC [Gordonia sp. TBRC 11910]|uniref:Type I-E CRISPR-associated protein Cas7/Cse4/CasC n=1 Tax=Gordonia asplenii TaxID=2725283 RepID=A0A848L3B7_9ACTN|nr:type I-E CRISPR-associated protein Cas7/Cse4/CasC [Gordonia asplenii]NMO04932.1 type I-E CRISPR-associated protein Cas7/Cse4/CasC [Gordonia asplenii]
MSLYLDFHAIQTVPPANINRDEDGSPKTTMFGGRRRARVSSQAWKRAIRRDFANHLDESDLGVRSLRIVDQVAACIASLDESLSERAEELAVGAVTAAGIKVEKNKARRNDPAEDYQKTGALLFLSNPQIDALAELAIRSGGKPDRKDAKAVLSKGNSIDLALFGRMIADSPDLNVDAAAQVAHAIGVHSVVPEFDYFTAVDDKSPDDNAGAGMIGTVEFNASTLYRYATVNVSALRANLGDDEATARAVEAFTRSFITSMPTGKQNTFANRTVPEFVLTVVRDDQPINLAGAFENALDESGDRAKAAAERILAKAKVIHDAFAPPVSAQVITTTDVTVPEEMASSTTLPRLIASLGDVVLGRSGASA